MKNQTYEMSEKPAAMALSDDHKIKQDLAPVMGFSDVVIECLASDISELYEQFVSFIAKENVNAFSSRAPGGFGKNNTFVLSDLSLSQALNVESTLIHHQKDYVATFGGYTFFSVDTADAWYTLTGRNDRCSSQLRLLDAIEESPLRKRNDSA